MEFNLFNKQWVIIPCLTLLASCQATNSPNKSNSISRTSPLPPAPTGYTWQLDEVMSDEFNGESLDDSKWQDHIKTWQGRPPAEFLPKNVSVEDGYLKVKTSSHPNPNDTYTMAGAAVAGKHKATYGYYEARIKASKTRMSTTFWLHSDGHEDRALGCGVKHAIELDILEAIGGWYDSFWTNVMHSNTHYKPTKLENGKCVGAKYVSKGVKHKTQMNFSDDFHVFSMWWKNPNEMTFYFDGEETGTVKLEHEIDPVAFNGPMSLRMVAETYYWQTKIAPEGKPPYPTEQELDDPKINTAYYDYVRSYQLTPAKANLIQDGDFEQPLPFLWNFSGQNSKRLNTRDASYNKHYGLMVAASEKVSRTTKLPEAGSHLLSFYGRVSAKNVDAKVQVLAADGVTVLAEQKVTSGLSLVMITNSEVPLGS